MRWLPLTAIMMAGLLTLTACHNKKESSMVIGAIYNLSGEQHDLDLPSSQGALLAIDQINGDHGLLDEPVFLAFADGESNLRTISEKTAALIAGNPDMQAIVGMSDTDAALAVARVAASKKRLLITSGATSPRLPEDVPNYLFLACYGDNEQAAAGAEFAFDNLKVRKIAVLYREGMSYTELLHGYFEASFKALGGEIVESRGYPEGGYADAIAKLADKDADAIYLAASPDEVIDGVEALRNAGITVPVLSGDGFDIGENWNTLATESKVWFTTHADVSAANKDPRIVAFRDAFMKRFPGHEPDAFTALGYDAVNLLAAAITKAGSTDVADVRKALYEMKYQGITGNISFKPGSQIPTKDVTVMRVKDGTETFVASFTPREVPEP